LVTTSAFLDINLNSAANVTTGQAYSTVIAKERSGEYLGDTVQVIPHITDELKRRMRLQAEMEPKPDVIITEIGGTVGDIESQPFMEAARQVRQDVGRDNVFFVHVTLVPYLNPSGELKTKPTQHSVAMLRSLGIQPDAIVCRSDRELPDAIKNKISQMCDVDREAVVTAADASSIYDIPKVLHSEGLDTYIIKALNLKAKDVDWSGWQPVLKAVHEPKHEVNVGLVGKYIDLPDAYLSVTEALRAGGFANSTKVNIHWIKSDDCESASGAKREPRRARCNMCSWRFWHSRHRRQARCFESLQERIKYQPLAFAWVLQCMVIEYSRNVVGIEGATSSEFEPEAKNHVIATMAEQVELLDKSEMGGTMRLGLYEAKLTKGSLVQKLYGSDSASERHRHRYEVNNAFRDRDSQVPEWSSPAPHPMAIWLSTWSFPRRFTPSTLPLRLTRSSSLAPPGQTHYLMDLSRPL
jgi:CTP synthase